MGQVQLSLMFHLFTRSAGKFLQKDSCEYMGVRMVFVQVFISSALDRLLSQVLFNPHILSIIRELVAPSTWMSANYNLGIVQPSELFSIAGVTLSVPVVVRVCARVCGRFRAHASIMLLSRLAYAACAFGASGVQCACGLTFQQIVRCAFPTMCQ